MPSAYQRARTRQPQAGDSFSFESIGADNSDRRMRFGSSDHLFEAVGEDPIVPKYHLAILALVRNLPECGVVIRDGAQEARIPVNSNPSIRRGVPARDVQGLIRAAVVDDRVFPIRVGLGKNALDARGEIHRLVVHRSHDAH